MSQPDGLQQNLLPAKRTALPSARRGPTNNNAAEAPASVDTASKTSQRTAAPKRKRKAPDQLPLHSIRNKMGSASNLENTTIGTQALEMKQASQGWEAILAKTTEQQLEFRYNLMAELQLQRQAERARAEWRLAYEGVKQQLQKKALEVIELQKKLDAKESSQTVNVQTVARSGSTVQGCGVGHRRNMQANAATQPYSQNGMRNSESSCPQQTAVGDNMNKTYRFINAG
ncbi:hypothetical protein M0657_012122 [Pyricularia oryzae]|nr:hypothetical protein M0657_012122 [Pyricularia oryzae]